MKKKVLFINGCVREGVSRTMNIANAYTERMKSDENIEFITRDLSKSNIRFLTWNDFDKVTGEHSEVCSPLAKEFAEADEIILAAPFWEFLFPAIVSCYFEEVSEVGIAFCYTERGSKGLCKANSLTYIYTAGGYLAEEEKLSEKYLLQLCKLYGIENFKTIMLDGLDIQTNDAKKMVKMKCEEIRKQSNSVEV